MRDHIARIALCATLAVACARSGPPSTTSADREAEIGTVTDRGDNAARAMVTLENTEWKLIILGGRPVLDSVSEPKLRLESSERRARGNTGCNIFNGSYLLSGDSLRFTRVAVTRRACADQEMNRQEGIFLESLDATRTWRVAGDTLTLSGEPGELARLVAEYPRE